MKKNWKIIANQEDKQIDSSIPNVIRQILANRGIDDYKSFISPKFNNLHDPYLIYDMDRAVNRILNAIEKKEKIIIYGDYDVDGVCATSILWEFLYRDLKAHVLPYIPHRVDEGYGLNEESIKEFIKKGIKLIITVDCGVRDRALIQKYNKDVDFVITDHHELPETLPDSIVIHPRHPKGKYPFGEISGGVVSWKLVYAIKQKLKLDNDENLLKGIDLAAFSTVCDVMPLIGENRTLVSLGLKNMGKGKRIGLNQLIKTAGIKKENLDAYHLGFILGPRINASGRLAYALDAVRLLVTESVSQALVLAEKLNSLNLKRQEITKLIFEEAEKQVASEIKEKLLFVTGDGWPEGIVGLVAGKITEKYHKPCLVASVNGDKAIGSARSISGFDIIKAIEGNSEKLVRYGGHSQAAGFTVEKNNIEDFRDSLKVLAKKVISDEDLIDNVEIDAELEFSDIADNLYGWIEKLKPFGYKNPNPDFLTRKVKVASIRTMGNGNTHLKLILYSNDIEFEAIGFGMAEYVEELKVGELIDVVYNINMNYWNGNKSLQLRLKDLDLLSES